MAQDILKITTYSYSNLETAILYYENMLPYVGHVKSRSFKRIIFAV